MSAPKCASCRDRVVLLVDLDCFYVQCAIKRDPRLAGLPVGIQQKDIVVTCSYEARAFGVTKLMSLKDAKSRCTSLVLVNGEDLTLFRACSAEVADTIRAALERYGLDAAMERVGMDECFLDVSAAVPRDALSVHDACAKLGIAAAAEDDHVYSSSSSSDDGPAVQHCVDAMRVGACIASDLRASILARTGFTTSVGISSSKLAAKLAAGMHKPRAQTTLYPWQVKSYLRPLDVRVLPGVGYATGLKLHEAGIHTCAQLAAAAVLPAGVAPRVQRLCFGDDDEPVKQSRAPLTVSDEDSFKCIATHEEAHAKLVELVTSLLPRIDDHYNEHHEWPRTVRVTVRHVGVARASRSAPMPANIGPSKRPRLAEPAAASAPSSAGSHAHDAAVVDSRVAAIVRTSAPLLRELLGRAPFHITLLNVAVTAFQSAEAYVGNASIADMFARTAAASASVPCAADVIVISDDDECTVTGSSAAAAVAVRPERPALSRGSRGKSTASLSGWLTTTTRGTMTGKRPR